MICYKSYNTYIVLHVIYRYMVMEFLFSMTPSLWKWLIFFLQIQCLYVTSTVALSYISTCCIYHTESLSVFAEVSYIWIFTHSPSLPLIAEKLFKGISRSVTVAHLKRT